MIHLFKRIYSIIRIALIVVQNLIFIPSYLFTNHVLLYPVYLCNSKFYWKIENILYNYLLYVVSAWSWCAGIVVYECGANWSINKLDSESGKSKGDSRHDQCSPAHSDKEESFTDENAELNLTKEVDQNEKILFISNHQSTSDVPLLFAMFSNYWSRVVLWVMDAQFKLTNFGVVSWTHGDFFIKPREFKAGDLVAHCLKHSYKNCYILFPEGGFRYKKQASSNRFADKNGLMKLRYTTWPRFGAFKDLLDRNLNVTRIVDCTILYSNIDKPISALDIMKGDKQSKIYMHYNTYQVDNEQLDEEWLRNVWMKKEELMRLFYENRDEFLNLNPTFNVVNLSWIKIFLVNVFFTVLGTLYILFFRYCLFNVCIYR